MKYLISTIDKPHYLWQILVQINNFRRMGIEQDAYFIIMCQKGQMSRQLEKIVSDPDLNCHFEVYTDDRKGMMYASTLRLRGIIHFWNNNEWFEKETFMYLDPDVIFTQKYDWSHLEKGDTWYVSDTRSYLDTKYIKSKSEQLFQEMCDIVGIYPTTVEAQDSNCGGAQYIMKNVPFDFWEKVEYDSERLYKHMKNTESVYHPQHPIQSWTADMWAVLWNGIYFNYTVEIAPDMEFCWASNKIDKWNQRVIFHNAGVPKEDGFNFCKTTYQKSPFFKDIKVNEQSASYMYLQEIKDTEVNLKRLLF